MRYSADRPWRHLYGYRWQQERKAFLAAHPLCRYCEQQGLIVAAKVVDHITPHKGDEALFWCRDNWQPLCKPCHDSAKQRLDLGQGLIGCDTSGLPMDRAHHWYR